MKKAPWQEGVALITGASAGLGAEFARQLANSTQTIVLVARRAERLEELRGSLKTQFGARQILCYTANLQRKSEILRLEGWLRQEKIAVDLLVNNAGLGDMGLFESADWDKIEAMLQVNIKALTLLTHLLLPGMIQRQRGVVLNIGSIAGYAPLPTFAVYAASKAYVNSFSEALHWELRGTGVSVTAMCPGPIPTEFFKVAERTGAQRALASPSFMQQTAEHAVAQALHAAAQGKPRIVPGLAVRFVTAVMGKLPLWWLRLVYRVAAVPKAQAQRKG